MIAGPVAFGESLPAYQHHPPAGCSSQASLVPVLATLQMHEGPVDTLGGLSPAPQLCQQPSEEVESDKNSA